jgi:hypothetical protein
MTQADSVLSMPPTNTSVTRRSVLGTAAGAAAALASTGASPMAVSPAPDPIFAAIERHRAAGIVWNAAMLAMACCAMKLCARARTAPRGW